MTEYYVEKKGNSGRENTFATLTEALAALPREGAACITLGEGVYEENLSICRDGLTIQGAGAEKTVITGKLGAFEILEDGLKRGTFRTQTVFLHGKDITLRDLTIENTAGPGGQVGQAVALYADGDRLTFERVWLLGNQDTLFTGPLPEKEREPRGFRGPLEFAPRERGRQYYRDCRIEGTVDFIFGGAVAYFENCELVCRRADGLSYITAACTPKGQEFGYVFADCKLTAEPGITDCWLGRPWREDAKVVFLNCQMGAHIRPEGWHDWSSPTDPAVTTFAEYHSTGVGAAGPRASFARELTDAEAGALTREAVLGTDREWNWK